MQFQNPSAEIYIPDHKSVPQALARITHLGIGAHQDDLEFMAFHGILACFSRDDHWFGGVTCTNGAGSSRAGAYAACSDNELMAIRRREQNVAADIGGYGAMIQLDYPSTAARHQRMDLVTDLKHILAATRPEVVYTHNPADKHDTHVGVTIAALLAIRELPHNERPQQLIGCEVWRSLDWLLDSDKVIMNVNHDTNLATALNAAFDSQISGGKRYDLAIHGRRAANATFFDPYSADSVNQVILGMDLTPLILDDSLNISTYVRDLIEAFQADVRKKLIPHL